MTLDELLKRVGYKGRPTVAKNHKTEKQSVVLTYNRSGGVKDGLRISITGSEGKYITGAHVLPLKIQSLLLRKAKVIIHGGEKSGVDQMFEDFAIHHNIPTIIHRPFDYGTNGGICYLARNRALVEDGDVLIGGISYGTRGTINSLYNGLDLGRKIILFDTNDSEWFESLKK